MPPSLTKILTAEAFGTFWIVFAGTGAIIINDMTGSITHAGVALSFGLAVFVMISALGDISGAHFNPAVTLGFYIAKRFPASMVPLYIASQLLGAFTASIALHFLFPSHATLGATLPAGSAMQSWIFEVILTLSLMFVILSVSNGAKEKGITAGLAVGGLVALEALFAGPICGASMNPARSLAPALMSGHVEHLWIYCTAPFIGASIAVLLCACTRESTCCAKLTECNS